MNGKNRFVLCLLLIVVMLSLSTFVVFAKELGLLTISGPGIRGEVALTDRELMTTLEASGFFDQAAFVKPPENLNMDAGYSVTAHLNLDGQLLPYVQMTYFAADQGQPGYVHYTARFTGESLQPVDQWQRLTPNADNTFRGLLSANDITLQPALVTAPAAPAVEPIVIPAASPAPLPDPLAYGVLAAALVLLGGAGLALRRRAVSQAMP